VDQLLQLKNVQNGMIPSNLDPNLLEKVKTVFTHAFQDLYWVSFALAILTFLICWGLKKEILIKKDEASEVKEVNSI
jgi:hypothetical protein